MGAHDGSHVETVPQKGVLLETCCGNLFQDFAMMASFL